MHTTRYTLETVTPLFLRGPDGETPELRPPSFKGMLRYWWRALHPMPISELQSEEARRFGSAGEDQTGRSPMQLRLADRGLSKDRFRPVPRRGKDFQNLGFDPGQRFDLIVTVDQQASSYQTEIDATLRLMLLLGGLGNRSRRGFGALRLVAVDGAAEESSEDALGDVEAQLARLETPFERDGRTIAYVGRYTDGKRPEYPWIQRIQAGTFWSDWREGVEAIARVAHQHNSCYTGDYKPRLSSPLYVTVASDDRWCWPLVTTLYLPDSIEERLSGRKDTRDEFRSALL